MWRGCGKGSASGAGKRSPVVACPFRPPSDGSAYRNTNLWEPMTWLQYCGFKTNCPFKYKEYDLYKSIIIYLTKESFAHLWYRDVSSFDECDWLCATLVPLCEWSGFLKQPLFGDEAGFSAAVIGAFLSSLSQGIVSSWFTMMKTFNFFTTGQSLILPMSASPRDCLCKVRNFPVLNLLRLQRKKNISPFFVLFAPLEKTIMKWEFGKFFSSVE